MTRLLDRMETRNLIQRERSRQDRRIVLTRITQDGAELAGEIDQPLQTLYRRLLGHVGDRKLIALIETLESSARRAITGRSSRPITKGNQEMSSASLTSAPAVWQIDAAHSSAQFSVRHLMISNVKGEFTKVSGTIVHDPVDPANSKVDVTIDADSINTRDAQRDTHLKSPDFFDTAKFPTITFRSTEIRRPRTEARLKET